MATPGPSAHTGPLLPPAARGPRAWWPRLHVLAAQGHRRPRTQTLAPVCSQTSTLHPEVGVSDPGQGSHESSCPHSLRVRSTDHRPTSGHEARAQLPASSCQAGGIPKPDSSRRAPRSSAQGPPSPEPARCHSPACHGRHIPHQLQTPHDGKFKATAAPGTERTVNACAPDCVST